MNSGEQIQRLLTDWEEIAHKTEASGDLDSPDLVNLVKIGCTLRQGIVDLLGEDEEDIEIFAAHP